jgi:hypothetical protein
VTKEEALTKIQGSLTSLRDHIGGAWPLTEAFTDLDDHPDEDEHGGFNHEVGYVRGLCEAFGLDPVSLAQEIEERVQ